LGHSDLDGADIKPRSLHYAVRAKDARTAPVGMTGFDFDLWE